MNVVNGRLISVSESDVVNGVLDIKDNVHTVASGSIKYLKNLKVIKFGKCVRAVDKNAVNNCPNLEKMDFEGHFDRIGGSEVKESKSIPKEVDLIGGNPIFSECPKLTLEGIHFEYKDFDIGKLFLGDKTFDYIEQSAKSVERYFSSKDAIHSTKLDLQMISVADKLMQTGEFYGQIKQITNVFNSMSSKIVTYLNAEKDGQRKGDILMRYILENNILIPFPLLQYEAYRECQKNGVPFKCIQSTNTGAKGILRAEDNVVELYYKSAIKSEKNNRDKNIRLLFVIKHELTHLKQKYARGDSPDVRERIVHLDSIVPTLADGYKSGNNFKGHDLLADEINADLNAYESLLDDLRGRLKCSVMRDMMKSVYERKKERIKRAFGVGEDGIPKHRDYRAEMFNFLLKNCSPTERPKLLRCQSEYLELRLEAMRKGIDLYPELRTITPDEKNR